MLKGIKDFLCGIGVIAVGLIAVLLFNRGRGRGVDADIDGINSGLDADRGWTDSNIDSAGKIRGGIERVAQQNENIARGLEQAKRGTDQIGGAIKRLDELISKNRPSK